MSMYEFMSNNERKQAFMTIMEQNGAIEVDDQKEILVELQEKEYTAWLENGILKKIIDELPGGQKLEAISLRAVTPRHSKDPEINGAYFQVRASSGHTVDDPSFSTAIPIFTKDDLGIFRPSETFTGNDVDFIGAQLEARQALQREGFLPNLSKDLSSIEDHKYNLDN